MALTGASAVTTGINMLKIWRPVTEWQEFNLPLVGFKELVVQAQYFDKDTHGYSHLKEPEITLYKPSPPHCVRGFIDVPASIFPEKPKDVYWDEHVIANLEYAYNYLVKEGKTL